MKKLFCYRFSSLLLAGILVFSTCQTDEDKPIILKVSPDSGRAGDAVIISGLFLGHTTRIVFGAKEGTVIATESKTVSTQVPAGMLAGKMSVTVETSGGISNPLEFTLIPSVPEITTIAPAKGSPGMRVTLTGHYFSDAKEVALGDQKITAFEASSDTQLVINVPGNITPGEKSVTVTTPGGVSKQTTFTIVPPPSITSFTPGVGQTGKHVLISGANLTDITAVYFQDAAAVFELKSASLIDAVVPAAAATGKLKVVSEGGEALSTTDFVVEGAPVISSFTPASGTIGTPVTISGDHFLADAKVKFGSTSATTTFVSESQLKATVPAGAVTGPVSVETSAGTGSSSNMFLVVAAPSIGGFSPAKGVAGVTKITITGTNFKDISSMKFNGAEAGQANITINSLTSLDVKVPALASTGTVAITNPSGTGVSAAIFTIVDPASALNFTPSTGPVGALITINGFGFDNTSVVKFNGVSVDQGAFGVDSETSIHAKVPANSTTGKITVTTGNLTLSSTQNFTVIQPPHINSFAPLSGPAGTQVVVTGSNFDNAKVNFNGTSLGTGSNLAVTSTTISFNVPAGVGSGAIGIETVAGTVYSTNFTVIPPPQITSFSPTSGDIGSTVIISGSALNQATSVKFNGTEVGSLNFQVNTNTIAAKVPAGATTGVITVTTPAGSATSTGNFVVAPLVASFSPASGPIGTPVTISGNNFNNVTGVSFSGIAATFAVHSATSLEAKVPAGASTGAIAVTTAAGTGSSITSFRVIPPPVVAGFTPIAGVAGSSVTIIGSGFSDVNSVAFNQVGTVFTIVDDRKIIATVPQAATSGMVTVSSAAGTGSVNVSFTVISSQSVPVLTAVTPSSGVVNSHIILTGTYLDQVTKVTIGGVQAGIVSRSGNSIEVAVPAQSLGTKTVYAFSPIARSNDKSFTVTP
jgi:hypothetical protein